MANTATAQRPAETTGDTSPAAPIASFRYGNVSTAIFGHTRKGSDGREFIAYNVSLRRVYRDANGALAYSASLHPEDLLFASYALLKCCDALYGPDGKLK
jgi:hypothetical protein